MSITTRIKNFLRPEEALKSQAVIEENVAIDIEHVAMEFKVSKDKIDTLKEYFIRTIKRNKTGNKKIRILDDITFKVYKGERVGILGFNGAGKSTLLKVKYG